MSFDFEKFADRIESGLQGHCGAYAFVVSYKDGWRVKRAKGKARTSKNLPTLDITTDTRFHTASVSKAVTGAAMLKILHKTAGMSLDSPFHTMLPDHWTVHNSLRNVTYKQLLTHRSGFRFGGNLTYTALKRNMADGINTADINQYDYQGENFAVMRLLIPRMAGYPILQAPHANNEFETLQAAMYSGFYIKYVNDELFSKAGLPDLKCAAMPFINGVCYHFPSQNNIGTDFGDQTSVVGSKGWVMSAAEMGRFFRTLHHTESIMPHSLSDRMKDELLGYDQKGETSEGIGFWWKNGMFPGSQNAGELNTLTISYQNGVSVALVINTELTGNKGTVGICNDAHDAAYSMKIVHVEDIKRKNR